MSSFDDYLVKSCLLCRLQAFKLYFYRVSQMKSRVCAALVLNRTSTSSWAALRRRVRSTGRIIISFTRQRTSYSSTHSSPIASLLSYLSRLGVLSNNAFGSSPSGRSYLDALSGDDFFSLKAILYTEGDLETRAALHREHLHWSMTTSYYSILLST